MKVAGSDGEILWRVHTSGAAGLDDRVEILLCDYRDLRGTYDRVVSIEMVEAVHALGLETCVTLGMLTQSRPGG